MDEAVTFVFHSSMGEVGACMPLVCVCSELLQRGHDCKFLAYEEHYETVVAAFGAVSSRRLREHILSVVMVLVRRSEREDGLGRALATIATGRRVVGVIDVLARWASSELLRLGVPYYVAYAGTVSTLAALGIVDLAWHDLALYASFWLRRLAVVKLRAETDDEQSRLAEAARRVYDKSVACFCSSFEPGLLAPDVCLARRPDDRVRLVRSFGPSHDVLPDVVEPALERFFDSDRGIVLVSVGTEGEYTLTAAGVRSLYGAVADGRWNVVWKIANRSVFDEARIHDIREPSDDWLFVTDDWIPQLAILRNPKTVCLVTHCGWNSITDALSCGVPILAAPLAADQLLNADFICRLGVAVKLDSADPDAPACASAAARLAAPAPPTTRKPERFSTRDARDALIALTEPHGAFQLQALSVQVNAYTSPDDYGASLVATTLEADLDDGTLADAFNAIEDDVAPTFTLSKRGLGLKRSSAFFSCADHLFSTNPDHPYDVT